MQPSESRRYKQVFFTRHLNTFHAHPNPWAALAFCTEHGHSFANIENDADPDAEIGY